MFSNFVNGIKAIKNRLAWPIRLFFERRLMRHQAVWKPTERIRVMKNQSNIMPDWSRFRSTMAVHPIDLRHDGCDKWATLATNSIKLQTQRTTIEIWNVRALYAFRERVDGCDSAGSPESHWQQIRLEEVIYFYWPTQSNSQDQSSRWNDDD